MPDSAKWVKNIGDMHELLDHAFIGKSLLESSEIAIGLFNENLLGIYLNPAFQKLADPTTPFDFSKFINHDYLNLITTQITSLTRGEETHTKFKSSNNKDYYLQAALLDSVLSQKRYLIILTQADTQEATRNIETQELDYRADLLANISDAFCRTNKNLDILEKNVKFKQLVETDASQLKSILEQTDLDKLQKTLEREGYCEHINLRVLPGKQVLEVNAWVSFPEGGEEYFNFILKLKHDSSQQAIDKEKYDFVHLASHQLKTPITIINWYIQLLADSDQSKLTLEQKTYLLELNNAIQRLLILVNNLLNISRLETGFFPTQRAKTNITKLVKQIISEVSKGYIDKKIKIQFDNKIEPQSFINLDRLIFGQVLRNLISNAVVYNKSKVVKIVLTVSIENEELITKVKDNGVGIPKDEAKKIFKKFFRGQEAQKLFTEGNGVELYINKLLLQAHSGRISFSTEPGVGSTFWFSIPLNS